MVTRRTRGVLGLTAALSLGLLISTTSGFSQADDRLPDVLTCAEFAAAPAGTTEGITVRVAAGTACALTDVALPGDLIVEPGAVLQLDRSAVAGTIVADAAARLDLTDVAVAGPISSTGAGTVPGPVDPALDPTAPALPVVALTRVDGESGIDLTGTVGQVVVAGTDLLGHLSLTDTAGDLVLAAALPVPDPAAIDPASTDLVAGDPAESAAPVGDLPVGDPAVGDPAVGDPAVGDPAEPVADAGGAPAASDAATAEPVVEQAPVRNLIGTDLNLTRTQGQIVVDGTLVTGRVRLEGNAAQPQFGPQTLVGGGVVEVQPTVPDPTQPDPTLPEVPAPGGPADPAPTAPETDNPAQPAPGENGTDPVDGTDPADPSGDGSTEGADDTADGAEVADGGTSTEETPSTTSPGTDSPAPTGATGAESAAPTGTEDSAPAASNSSDGPSTTSAATEEPTATSTRPALPDGLTVDFGSRALVDLGAVRQLHGVMTASGSLAPVSLTDTRDGAPGWSVSAQLTDFTGGNRSIGAANLGWTPKLLGGTTGAELGPQVAPGGSGQGLSVNRRLGSAAPGEGTGTTVLGADLQLQLTDQVDPGTYTATLVITVLS